MVSARRPLVTEEEFLAMPESKEQIELIDGEVRVAPAATSLHQLLVGELHFELKAWARSANETFTVIVSPSDVRFRRGRILQPDVYVLRGRLDVRKTGPIDEIPLLCVEVLSRDRVYDRVTKRLIYAAAGVREYWVVDRSGFIERWSGDELEASEEITGLLTSPVLPGFQLDVAAMFARLTND